MKAVYLASDLLRYCEAHPEQRFWQALANWSGQSFVCAGHLRGKESDTWNWKGMGPEE